MATTITEEKKKSGDIRHKITVRVTVDGKSKQKSKSGFKTRKDARAFEKKLKDSALKELIKIQTQGNTFCEIADKWFNERQFDVLNPISSTTLKDNRGSIDKWCWDYMKLPASQVNRADISLILKRMDDDGRSKSHQRKVKGIINSIYIWAIERRIITNMTHPPTYGIRISRKGEKLEEILTPNQVTRLLSEAYHQNHKWFPIWLTAVYTGLRSGELFSLLKSDVDYKNKTLVVSKSYDKRTRTTGPTKNRKWRIVPLNEEVLNLFRELKAINPDSEYLLPRIRDWSRGNQASVLREFCKCIGLPSVRFHSLRACWATHMLQNGVSPVQLMAIGGWANLSVIQHYVRRAGIHTKGITDCLDFSFNKNTENVVKFASK